MVTKFFSKSNKVRFDQNKFLIFLGRIIYDKNGNTRSFVQDAVSMTVSSDHGKGSLKAVLAFNCPKYRIGPHESVLLAYTKATEESVSLDLLFESSWLLTIQNFAKILNIPIYITGIDHKLSSDK